MRQHSSAGESRSSSNKIPIKTQIIMDGMYVYRIFLVMTFQSSIKRPGWADYFIAIRVRKHVQKSTYVLLHTGCNDESGRHHQAEWT